MPNLEFSVPYNNDPEILKDIFELKRLEHNRIREVYLSGPQEYSGSGRVTKKINLDEFAGVVDKIHSEGLKVNLVLNTTCEGGNWYSPEAINTIMEYLRQLHEQNGLEAVTIANPIYIKEVRRRFPNIEICASVLCDIDCVQRAVIYANLGANIITPDVNINHNLKLLKDIKEATKAELKLLVNEGCLYKCPFRKFHFNYISHVSKESFMKEYFLPYCHNVIEESPSQILKSGWIRPEDTMKYGEITSFFKIVNRVLSKSKVVRAIKAYLEESWDGDLLDIISSSLGAFSLRYGTYLDNKSLDKYGFFEKVTSCDRNCTKCDYCEKLVKDLLRFGLVTEEKLIDTGSYTDYDME